MQKCGFLLLQKRKYFTLESLQALASIEPEANVIVMDIFRLRELIIINHVITSKATKYFILFGLLFIRSINDMIHHQGIKLSNYCNMTLF